jgi:hypothetical protein
MRYEFKRQDQAVGWAQWEGPGQVALVMSDQDDRDFFQEYFSATSRTWPPTSTARRTRSRRGGATGRRGSSNGPAAP